MKFNYELEFLQIDDSWSCVPLDNENGDSFHGVIDVNDSAKEMLETIGKSETLEEAFNTLLSNHPEETAETLKPNFDEFVSELVKEGLLTL